MGTGSLQLMSVQEKDAGNYQCRAENREDSVDATATLHVQGQCMSYKSMYATVSRAGLQIQS